MQWYLHVPMLLTVAEVRPMTSRQTLATDGRYGKGPVNTQVLEHFLCLMGCKIKSKNTRKQSGCMHRTDIPVDLSRSCTVHLSLGPRSRVTWKASMSCLLLFKLVRQLSITAVSGPHRGKKIIQHLKKETNSTNQPKKQSKQCLPMKPRLVFGFYPSYLRVTEAPNLL